MPPPSVRAQAVLALEELVGQGKSLSELLPRYQAGLAAADAGLLQEYLYGLTRWYYRLQAMAGALLHKPLRSRDRPVLHAILLGLYQLEYLRTPAHAAVQETVNILKELKKDWATGLVNASLRRFLRERESVLQQADAEPSTRFAWPAWLLQRLAADWPGRETEILQASNARPPLVLRVNTRRGSREQYTASLAAAGLEYRLPAHAPAAVQLVQAVPVTRLPGFAEGRFSVQDGAAQLAAPLLGAQPGQHVLDACAAPGGKTTHVLELQPQLASLLALEVDATRLEKVRENLQRLGLQATLQAGDAGHPAAWWDGRPFDRILLDAPCSATGVIRRHPDIKLLRRAQDIPGLVHAQARILESLWPLLAAGGKLLYCTCSIIKAENEQQMLQFLAQHEDAHEIPIAAEWGEARAVGRQILPGSDGMDGFYYACLQKSAN